MVMLILLLTAFFVLWIISISLIHDFSLPALHLSNFKHALVVFPHPDDEVLTLGGLIGVLRDRGVHTTLLTLTKGEKGTPTAKLNPSLKSTRSKELESAAKILGFNQVTLSDYGDGQLNLKEGQITKYLNAKLKKIKPDVVFSYDLSGLYGHPDHISVSKVITNLIDKKYPNIKLIYVSQSQKMLHYLSLPTHMAQNQSFLKARKFSTHKIFVGHKIFNKIHALYCHQSQLASFKKSMPHFLPLWFFISLSIYEYFYDNKA